MTGTPQGSSSVLDAPLVPLGRLGALLITRRRSLDMSLEEMAIRSGGRFSPVQLSDIERARAPLDDSTMRVLAELYGLENGIVAPERSRLVLDFHADQIRVGERVLPLRNGAQPIDSDERVDAILQRYLSLLYLLRNQPLGSRVSLREPDLIVLSSTLHREVDGLEARLVSLMGAAGVTPRTQSLLKRFLLPSAGLLVAASSVGSLVIVNGPARSGTVTTPLPAHQVAAATQIIHVSGQTGGGIVPQQAAHTDQATSTERPGLSDHRHDHHGGHDHHAGHNHHSSGGGDASSLAGSPVTTRSATTAEERAAVGAEAEALISYDWKARLPDWTVAYEADDARYKGLTNVPDKSITIYLEDAVSVEEVAGVLAHEIGHALDVTHLDDDQRRRWIESRDMAPVWWAGSGLTDFSVGSGDFAEAVARHLVNSPSDATHGEFSDEQLALVVELLP